MVKLLFSYPLCWMQLKTRKKHNRGFLRVWKNRNGFYVSVDDVNYNAYLPIGMLKLIFKELEKRKVIRIEIPASQRRKAIYDFDNGININKSFSSFKYYGQYKNLNSDYLKWKLENKLQLTPSEEKKAKFRMKTGVAGWRAKK